MKIAITADLHLASRQQHPERYSALENILSQLHYLQIDKLIIAGDLFDAKYDNFAEFEGLCRLKENRDIQILVIPGNHDQNISRSTITADNVHIFSEPELVSLDSISPDFLFIPYREGKAMGDQIADFFHKLKPDGWVLVSHGDWMGNVKDANTYEAGIYMPLSTRDLNVYKPIKVFLGHIHAYYFGNSVYFPGSPCGIDITETGRRRFLIYDTLNNSVIFNLVDTQYLYFNRTFTIFPVDDEAVAVEGMLQSWIASWELKPEEKAKVRVRVRINGYATDKSLLKQAILNSLGEYQLNEDLDLGSISVTADPARGQILNMVKDQIYKLDLPRGLDEPDQDQILLAAIKLVYGG